jgi:hypothetical protein
MSYPLALVLGCAAPSSTKDSTTSVVDTTDVTTGDGTDAETETETDGDTGSGTDTGTAVPPLGTGLLFYEGDGAMPHDAGPFLIDGIDELVALYADLGVEVTTSATWPDDPTPYGLVFVFLPGSTTGGAPLAEATLAGLEAWLDRGGRLLLAGDVDGEYAGYDLTAGNDAIDATLQALGIPVAVNAEVDGAERCTGRSRHPLMADRASVSWYASNALEVAPPAEWLECDALALYTRACGEVLVAGDVNPFSDRPDLAEQLLANLATVPVACGAR